MERRRGATIPLQPAIAATPVFGDARNDVGPLADSSEANVGSLESAPRRAARRDVRGPALAAGALLFVGITLCAALKGPVLFGRAGGIASAPGASAALPSLAGAPPASPISPQAVPGGPAPAGGAWVEDLVPFPSGGPAAASPSGAAPIAALPKPWKDEVAALPRPWSDQSKADPRRPALAAAPALAPRAPRPRLRPISFSGFTQEVLGENGFREVRFSAGERWITGFRPGYRAAPSEQADGSAGLDRLAKTAAGAFAAAFAGARAVPGAAAFAAEGAESPLPLPPSGLGLEAPAGAWGGADGGAPCARCADAVAPIAGPASIAPAPGPGASKFAGTLTVTPRGACGGQYLYDVMNTAPGTEVRLWSDAGESWNVRIPPGGRATIRSSRPIKGISGTFLQGA